VKSATSETWWPEDADHIMFIRGRIGFDLPAWFVPADEKQKPTSAFFAGAIAVFDKTWRGECFSYIDRVELEAKGRASMALAQFAVGQVSQAKDVDQLLLLNQSPNLSLNLASGRWKSIWHSGRLKALPILASRSRTG
jgi:hypothetical protein